MLMVIRHILLLIQFVLIFGLLLIYLILILLQDKMADMQQIWANERDFTTKKVIGYGVEEAFPDFLSRKGRD